MASTAKPIKIFIGSTFSDLQKYRKVAIDICRQQLALDVTAVAMETFAAEDTPPIEACLRKVHESDLYIGIFAHRYGFIPALDTRSVTELEFDEAAHVGIDRLCFLIKDSHPWNPQYVECAQQDKLKTLKQRINEATLRAEFTSLPNFREVFSAALKQWLSKREEKQRQQAALVIDEEAGITIPQFPDEPWMVGREDEIAVLKQRLGIRGTKQSLNVIQGLPGIGKTTLVKKLAYDPEIKGMYPDGIFWIDIGQVPDIDNELDKLARSVFLRFDKNQTREKKRERIKDKLLGKKVLLIVDDVWTADDALQFDVMDHQQASMLVTTRLPLVAEPLQTDFHRVRRLNVSESHDLLVNPKMAPTFCATYPDLERKVIDALEGLPLALQVAARLLENQMRRNLFVGLLFTKVVDDGAVGDATAPTDRFDPKTGTTPTVREVIKQSIQHLDKEAKLALALLNSLPAKPATFSLDQIVALWKGADDPVFIASRLIDWGLLEPTEDKRFQVHWVIMSHTKELYDDYRHGRVQ